MNSRTREGFYTLWTAAILLCLAMSLFVLVYTSVTGGVKRSDTAEDSTAQSDLPEDQQGLSDQEGQAGDEAGTGETSPEDAPTEDGGAAPAVPEGAGVVYQENLILLGGGTAYGFASSGVLPIEQVWVPASQTFSLANGTAELIDFYAPGTTDAPQSMTVAETAAMALPQRLVIALGIGELAGLDENSFRQYYTDLITAIQTASPNTRIMCLSVFPTVDSLVPPGYDNVYVRTLNDRIAAAAGQAGVPYLDVYSTLLDDTGNLKAEYAGDDGIRLLPAGYAAVIQFIRMQG